MGEQSKRIFGLDVVRSVAILSVLACHWLLAEMGNRHTVFSDGVANSLSTFGVELFFTLSGYLIGGILIRDLERSGMNRETIFNFWRRRWYRTLPNYYFYLVLAIIMARPWKHKIDAPLPLYPLFLQNFAWKISGFFGLSWSLSIEEWFYLFFPLLAATVSRFARSKKQTVLVSIVIFLAVPFLIRQAMSSRDNLWLIHGIVVCRLDAIAAGVSMAFIKRYHPAIWSMLGSIGILAVGVAGLAAMAVYIGVANPEHTTADNPWRNILFFDLVDLPCALLLPWCSNWTRGRGVAVPIFTWISILSYSLYLCNMLAIDFVGFLNWRLPVAIPGPVNVFLEAFVSLVMALLSYHLVEKRFLRIRDKSPGKMGHPEP